MNLMNILMFGYVVATIFGLAFGSFAGAMVWRLRARQLKEDKAAGEKVDDAEYKRLLPLTKVAVKGDRSRCLQCGHELRWYDLVPLFSWLSTRGNCRYCKKPIGRFEPLMELGTAALFVGFYYYWLLSFDPASWPLLIVWAIILVLMMILLAYDAKWFLLPNKVMFTLIILAGGVAAWNIASSTVPVETFWSTAVAVLILGGLYLALWVVSRGAWVGFGDVKLGLALGLLLGDWQLAFLALFLANLLGVIAVMPGLVSKKISRKTHVPFGPFLIGGFFISLFIGSALIDAYLNFTTTLML